MDTFEKALKFTLQWEGGYVNHPNDKGGPTNMGITQKTYDDYLRKNDLYCIKHVKDISDFEVQQIYRKEYWNRIDGDGLLQDFAIAAFDFAVNSGVTRAKSYINRYGDLNAFLLARENFLRTIGVGKNAVFLKGWLNRINALRKYIRDEV